MQALVDAVMTGGGCNRHASNTAASAAAGAAGHDERSSCGGLLEQLGARVALARARAGAAAVGGDGAGQAEDVAAEELQALRLEARDAAEALLHRCRQVAALRRSLFKQPERLGRLAEAGPDGAPLTLPLLRQIVGELGVICVRYTGCAHSSTRRGKARLLCWQGLRLPGA